MESISVFQSTTQGDISELKDRLIQAEERIERLQKNIKERVPRQQPPPYGQGGPQPFPVDPRYGYLPQGQPMYYGPPPGMIPGYYPYAQMPQPHHKGYQEKSGDSSFQQERQTRQTKESKNVKRGKNLENEESKSDISSRMDRSQVDEADTRKTQQKVPYRQFIGLQSEKEEQQRKDSQLDSSQLEQLNEDVKHSYPEFSNVEVDPEHTTVAIIREALPGGKLYLH